jgi:hypothetical protein
VCAVAGAASRCLHHHSQCGAEGPDSAVLGSAPVRFWEVLGEALRLCDSGHSGSGPVLVLDPGRAVGAAGLVAALVSSAEALRARQRG